LKSSKELSYEWCRLGIKVGCFGCYKQRSKDGGMSMLAITANELKRNGVSGIERAMLESDDSQVFVDVRGKAKYVILAVDEFNLFREYQLDKAIAEAEQCLASDEVRVIDDLDGYAEQLRDEIKCGA